MKINYTNVNTNKLHDELIAGGVIPMLVESLGEDTWITYKDDEDMTKVNDIVSKHNPAPLQQLPTLEEQVKALSDAITALMGV